MTDQPRWTEYVPVDDLPDAPTNPKGHADAEIKASIERFGFAGSPVVDERTGKLVGGHGRRDALQRLRDAGAAPPDGVVVRDGVWYSPVERGWASKNDAEAEAFGLALNRTTEIGGWQNDELRESLERLAAIPDGLLGVGFTQADLDELVALATQIPEPENDKDADAVPDITEGPAVTKPGDVWHLGPHRVICGDAREPDTWVRLLGDEKINVAFTSPPYADRRKYDASTTFRPIPPDEYVEWFKPIAEGVAAHLAGDGSWFVNIKPGADGLDTELYVMDLVIAHAREWGWHFATEFCWERTGVPKSVVRRFKNGFEPVYQFARGEWKMRPRAVSHRSDNVPMSLGAGSGNTSWHDKQGTRGVINPARRPRKNGTKKVMSDVQALNVAPNDGVGSGWAYPNNRLPTFTGSHNATGHTAAFPVGLPQWFIRAFSDEGDVICDPFTGSGSTIIAAHNEKRVGRGIEISPAYVDVICKRWFDYTGQPATHAETGEVHPLTR